MEELENEINNAVEGQVDETPETPAENNTSLRDELNKISSEQEEIPQELWKQSSQFKNGLWKTPDDIMNSVQYYEKKFQPLEQSLKRMGFNEPAQLEQAFKEYQEKLPVYQENENTINLLNALLQNEVYGSKLRGVFNEIRKAQEMERFGMAFDDLPPIIKEKVTKGEQALQMVEEMKQEKAYNDALGTIQEQMAQIEQIVADNGLEFDKQAFLEYCRDNNIAPSNMQGEFLKSNYTQMLEKAKQNASLATTIQNKQNKANAINSSTKTQAAPPPKEIKTEQDLKAALLAID
jgi:uncharacterized protein YifE (UPF0438 family)